MFVLHHPMFRSPITNDAEKVQGLSFRYRWWWQAINCFSASRGTSKAMQVARHASQTSSNMSRNVKTFFATKLKLTWFIITAKNIIPLLLKLYMTRNVLFHFCYTCVINSLQTESRCRKILKKTFFPSKIRGFSPPHSQNPILTCCNWHVLSVRKHVNLLRVIFRF